MYNFYVTTINLLIYWAASLKYPPPPLNKPSPLQKYIYLVPPPPFSFTTRTINNRLYYQYIFTVPIQAQIHIPYLQQL